MNEEKIKNSFQNVKKDIDEIKSGLSEILNELKRSGEIKFSKESSNKIFTSKVSVTKAMTEATMGVFNSGIFTSGEKNKEFERKFGEYCGTKHAIAVSNGTVSIELILRGLGIKKGDEIIVPSHTTMPTVEPVLHIGAKPVFADCLEETYNLNPKDVLKKITKKTKAVIVVHLYGNSGELDKLLDICKKKKIYLIEDCAQSHGTRYGGKHVGTFGVAGSFSFYPTKNLTVCGEGGMIITDNDALAKEIRMMANHGEDGRYNHVILGGNYRLSEIHAAIGIEQLKMLESFVERRREIAKMYGQLLDKEKIILPKETKNSKHSYHLYVIRVKNVLRDKIINKLKEDNIFLGIHYPTPVHQQPVIKNLKWHQKLKVTEKISKEIISLPIYPSLRDEQVKEIAKKINSLV